MPEIRKIAILLIFLVFIQATTKSYSQQTVELTLDNVINKLALESSQAKILHLNFQNKLLQYENFKKSYLPSVSFNLTPFSFNRSLKLLQQPSDGSYTYVDDYSNNSSAGITVTQKIGLTGGNLTVGSNLNYLNEFSRKNSSFNSTPYTIGYSQQLWGGGRTNKYDRQLEEQKYQEGLKSYCGSLSDLQKEAMGLYMSVFLAKLELDLSQKNVASSDTLLSIAKLQLQNGSFTTYDYNQVEMQAANSTYTSEKAQKNYQSALQKLIIFLDIEPESDRLSIKEPGFDLPILLDSALVRMYVNKNNPFALTEKIKKLEAEKSLLSTKMSTGLNGNISLNYGANQYAKTLHDAYIKPDSRQSINLGLQIPIFQWGVNKNKVRIAQNSYEVNKLEMEKSNREFYNGIIEQTNSYNHSIKLWILAEKTYKLSQEQYILSIQKFGYGKISVYELISTQKDQSAALQKYYQSINDAWNSYFNLRKATLYDFVSNKELEDLFLKDKKP